MLDRSLHLTKVSHSISGHNSNIKDEEVKEWPCPTTQDSIQNEERRNPKTRIRCAREEVAFSSLKEFFR